MSDEIKDQKTDETKDVKEPEQKTETTEQPKNDEQPTPEIKTEEPKPAEETKVEAPAKVEEKPASEVKEEVKEEKPKPEPSGKFKDLIKQIEELSVIELSELVKELEQRFGVSAAAPVAVAASGAAGDAAGEEEEKANYTVMLTSAGDQKINVIKTVREVTELGLKDAKDLVDSAPKEVKKDVPKEEAEEIKKKLEAAGAKVELK